MNWTSPITPTQIANGIKNLAAFLSMGKLIMWFFTMNMVALIWYATANDKKIDSSVGIIYGSALTAYVTSKGFESAYAKYDDYRKSKTTKKMENGDV